MTLQSSPPISLLDICNEFLAPAGTPLSEFYRGGGRVPDVAVNAGVPTSGPISLMDFLGASRYTPFSVSVARSGGDAFRTEPAPIQVSVSGSLTATATGGTGGYSYSWAYVGGGSGSQTWSTASGGRIVNATDNVNKNSVRDLVFQLTITDGVTTYQQNHTLRLTYSTDL